MATRRQFIRISAIGAGTVMAGAAGLRLLASEMTDGQKATLAALTGRTPDILRGMFLEMCRVGIQGR
ncbi:MAG: hypothetical protein MZV63_31515 [Marinilabiliales bacterium]|nr:hypothetical protein [Marinilabiliales bacterium]